MRRLVAGNGTGVNCSQPRNAYLAVCIWQNMEMNRPDLVGSSVKVDPTGRFCTPAEVAIGVVFISGPAASRISGANLVIDGALTVAV